ncbi:DEAD/DEAH box helicase [Hyalangium gracile]|uniref:DEAD/DEAH box helicase n=1 Tax=Hyalangium gracile TaxID=394092 RepID=UPI001CD00455|nr:DEAD/DEAH box helicase [Hyalangium gracile]
MQQLMPFQEATAAAGLRTLQHPTGPRRFLVADEVGLGKTVVAQRILHGMLEGRSTPLVVLYVCSNLAIAYQNVQRLAAVLPEEEREQACCDVDRLSLLPSTQPPSHPRLHLYSLTPHTSLPQWSGSRGGIWVERALLEILVERIAPEFLAGRPEPFSRGVKDWKQKLAWMRGSVTSVDKVSAALLEELFAEFKVDSRQRLLEVLKATQDELAIIMSMRNALASAGIRELRPDLVILDEFQKFRDLLSVDGTGSEKQEEDRVAARLIRGHGKHRHGLLLLSATPYRLFTRRWEDASEGGHHADFFELIEFLAGGHEHGRELRRECERHFVRLGEALRRGEPGAPEAGEARRQLTTRLAALMARTERALHPAGWEEHQTEPLPAGIPSTAFQVYRHFVGCLAEDHKSWAVPYWNSIPLPMQTLGSRYQAWQKATRRARPGDLEFTQADRDAFQLQEPLPHARLAALFGKLPPSRLALPWLAPSKPWWPLSGQWKDAGTDMDKLLAFSRFRAVPHAVAALLSFQLERHFLAQQGLAYEAVSQRRLLTLRRDRLGLLALFHPSPWLIENTDPRQAQDEDLRGSLRQQLREALARARVPMRDHASTRPPWSLVARLDRLESARPWIRKAWEKIALKDEASEASAALDQWQHEAGLQLGPISDRELDSLADWALTAPGIVVGRALRRHWPQAVGKDGFASTLSASWKGLRSYLDHPLFAAILQAGQDHEGFPHAIRRAVEAGNLESVLDEHFWVLGVLSGTSGDELASSLEAGLRVHTSNAYFHPLQGERTFSLRCHVALPMTEARMQVEEDGTERSFRPDELRKAFNTPFWPHVLVSTSVGQEGLDFHAWCSSILHWDLPTNPIDLEQREGRIRRFAGRAIRRALAERFTEHEPKDMSPWVFHAGQAQQQLADASGLCPWWVYPGATVHRYILDVPLSEESARLASLKEERWLYRLALGQPNQEDLIQMLMGRISPSEVQDVMLCLSPWFLEKRSQGPAIPVPPESPP